MSKNISRLSARKGLKNNLFNRLVTASRLTGSPEASDLQKFSQEHLVGEAITHGTASFYDFTRKENTNKRAYICTGSACLCADTQTGVKQRLLQFMTEDEIGSICCLGRCHENRAFQFAGHNYSGQAIDDFDTIRSNGRTPGADAYRVASLLDPPILTAPFPGFETYGKSLQNLLQKEPADILTQIKTSGLRGRGGAGFPTGMKWEACARTQSAEKYIVCNADEGDPGAYIDRYLLEQRPHSVLYGMLVAGLLAGAEDGILYIRAEYPEAVDLVQRAIDEWERAGLVGQNICGSQFNFQFHIIRGAGAYICGEETALLASIEGRRPEVSIRPPYPTTEGLFGQPTVVNNVETFACIYTILEMGGEAFAKIGPEKSSGPKLVSLDGLFQKPGLYEVAMGTPLSTIVYELGGGFRTSVKALHIGGPLGGLVPIHKIDGLNFDFASFQEAGFLLGHAGVICIPESMPMLEYLEHLFEFCAAESCGKCYPCRLGSKRGQEMLAGANRNGQPVNRQLLEELLETMELGSLCALGGGLPLPFKNALTYFSDELKTQFR